MVPQTIIKLGTTIWPCLGKLIGNQKLILLTTPITLATALFTWYYVFIILGFGPKNVFQMKILGLGEHFGFR